MTFTVRVGLSEPELRELQKLAIDRRLPLAELLAHALRVSPTTRQTLAHARQQKETP